MKNKMLRATILMAEDDEDDRLLLAEAFKEANIPETVHFVKDGSELLDYLCQRNQYINTTALPELIILDLNMPKKDGREVLKEIKNNPAIRQIPVVILTTSNFAEDITLAYNLGANSFIVKPPRFDELVNVIRTLAAYWLGIVALPSKHIN